MTEYEELTAGGAYAKFDTPGDSVEGRIHSFTVDGGSDYNGEPCPEIVVETADGLVTVTCGAALLKKAAKNNATRVVPGHGIKVTYTEDGPAEKGKNPPKRFFFGVTSTPIAPIVVELTDDEAPF
jgi:hypothetical protein